MLKEIKADVLLLLAIEVVMGVSLPVAGAEATGEQLRFEDAKWIAPLDVGDDFNMWFQARKTLQVEGPVQRARIAITADTVYELYVNGRFVSDGPVRAFPDHYRYDPLDVSRFLRPGTNVIAVRVHHWGRDTAKSIAVEPGLLAVVEWVDGAGAHRLGTDRSWKIRLDPAHDPRSPIVSAHLGFEEHYDARRECPSWMTEDSVVATWGDAREIATPGEGGWGDLRAREIPQQVKTPVEPIAVLSVNRVRPPRIVSTLNVGRSHGIARKASAVNPYRFVLVSTIRSDKAQEATLLRPTTRFDFAKLRLAGREINTRADLIQQEEVPIKLAAGENPLIVVLDGRAESEEFQFVLDAEGEVTLSNPFGEGEWAIAGPYGPNDQRWKKLREATTLDDLNPLQSLFRVPEPRDVISADVHGLTCHRRALGADDTIETGAMLAENEACTVLPPGDEAVEFTIDFGKEYNAHIGFEIDAPEGVVVDGVVFERFHEGTPQWPWGVRASFRYVTRSGWQTFEAAHHFGGRYLALTVRGRPAPVRIRQVYGRFTHYPVADRGRFHCSDALLNNVWDICRQTMLSCMEDTFVDCPLYEQSLWLGDARNEALVCAMMFGDWRLVRRCCTLGCESVERGDLAGMRVPTRWGRVIPAWSFLWVRMCWENYWYSGDKQLLVDRYYPAVRKMLNTCLDKYIDPATGLFSIQAWQFIDWTELDNGHKIVTHNNTFLVDSLRLGAQMADLAGDADSATRFREGADRLVQSINKHLWSDERGAYIDSIHNDGAPSTSVSRQINTLALLHGVVPSDQEARVLATAMNDNSDQVVQFGSPFATLYLLELLGERGQIVPMLDVVRDKWGGMMDSQTTTFWESFATGNLGGKRYPTRSYCHAWSAGPAYVFSRYVLGARLEVPGGTAISLTPQLDVLERADGVIPLPKGTVAVKWVRTGKNEVALICCLEGDVEATMHLPNGWQFQSTKSTEMLLKPAGRQILRVVRYYETR